MSDILRCKRRRKVGLCEIVRIVGRELVMFERNPRLFPVLIHFNLL